MHHPHPSRLQELLDGALPAGEARALRAHLDACASCAREFAGLSSVAAALAAAPRPRLPAAFDRRVLAALRPSPWKARAAAAAGALCAAWSVAVAWAVASHGRPTWAALSATGEGLLSGAASAALLAAKLPLARAGALLLSDAVSALPPLLGACVMASAVIFALGRPDAAHGRTR